MLRRVRHALEFLILASIRSVLSVFPARVISAAGAAAGRAFFLFGVRAQAVRDNLRLSDLRAADERRIIRGAYANAGRSMFELALLDRFDPSRVQSGEFRLPGGFMEETRRGAVVVSLHLGSWELLAKALVQKGVRLCVVVRRQTNPFVDRLIDRERRRAGVVTVHDDDLRGVLQAARDRYCIGLMVDQDSGRNSVPSVFLGRPCRAARGPAHLVRTFGLPVYLTYTVRAGSGRHRFSLVRLPIPPSADEKTITRMMLDAAGNAVRAHPEQWLWQHRFWKTP
jgi:KDO2-lipid IV(A) lauroyltransferase